MSSDPHLSKNNPSPDEIVNNAEKLCLQIEAITLYVTRRMRMVLGQLLGKMKVELDDYDLEKMVSLFEDPSVKIDIRDIESSIDHFREHVPDNTMLRAALAQTLSRKYQFVQEDITELSQLLGLDSKAVKDSYHSLFDASIEEIYADDSEPDRRPFWYQLPSHLLREMMLDLIQEINWHYVPSGQALFKRGNTMTVFFPSSAGVCVLIAQISRG